MEDKEISGGAISFEFHKGNGTNRTNSNSHHHLHHKPTPSKWDDAQKWLMGLSRGAERSHVSNSQARNSNADDRRLIAPVPQKEQDYSSSEEEGEEHGPETKKIMDCDGSVWRVNKAKDKSSTNAMGVRSVCVRDMGTEMTPIASLEPSRAATPIRARTPISSGSSTPVRAETTSCGVGETNQCREESDACNTRAMAWGEPERAQHTKSVPEEKKSMDQGRKQNTLETRAVAWDEAERAKYMARYKREEVKIQAWENHEKRKAEMEMKKLEVKAERMKARAQERLANKLASTRRIAEEKRANAEAKLNEKAVRTSERADYIRRTGHIPSSFSFKLPKPSLCW